MVLDSTRSSTTKLQEGRSVVVAAVFMSAFRRIRLGPPKPKGVALLLTKGGVA